MLSLDEQIIDATTEEGQKKLKEIEEQAQREEQEQEQEPADHVADDPE